MKQLIFILVILIFCGPLFAQDTLVTNLNLKGLTVKNIAGILYGKQDYKFSRAFSKFSSDYMDGSQPNDNANVNIDSIHTVVLIECYRELRFNALTSAEFDAFATDILSKRATNNLLDAECDLVDANYTAEKAARTSSGHSLLIGRKP